MTINEILENESILPDRFGMAAISYIFKAFGDNIRSKEYWPWSEKVNCPWVPSKGYKNDIQTAINILYRMYQIDEDDAVEPQNEDKSIRKLKERLALAESNLQDADEIVKKINETSLDTRIKSEAGLARE